MRDGSDLGGAARWRPVADRRRVAGTRPLVGCPAEVSQAVGSDGGHEQAAVFGSRDQPSQLEEASEERSR